MVKLTEDSACDFTLITLKTGIISLRSLEFNETFHPVTGPQIEAGILHVNQQRLIERCAQAGAAGGKFVIWDVGFGAAANALAAIEALQESQTDIEFHSFDKTLSPLTFALQHTRELEYLAPHEKNLRSLITDREVNVTPHLKWKLHLGNFLEFVKRTDHRKDLSASLSPPHAIFYDPYSPVGNPEMWTLEHFTALRAQLAENVPCLLTNYTRSTAVRVTLLLAGFFVGIGCEVGEKAETTIATNRLELLRNPLNANFLKRVQISENAAPMRALKYSKSRISTEDFELLRQLPQFL